TRHHLRPHRPRTSHSVSPRLLPQPARPSKLLSQSRSKSLGHLQSSPPQVLLHRPTMKPTVAWSDNTKAARIDEHKVVTFIARSVRIAVASAWIAILVTLISKRLPHSVSMAAFEYFRIVSVLGALWLVAEGAEAIAGRTSFKQVAIDASLIVLMFLFW